VAGHARAERGALTTISEELSLHALAVEDAVREHQRPKLDRYDTHAFLTAYGVRFDAEAGTVATSELPAFITDRALVTVRKELNDPHTPVWTKVHLTNVEANDRVAPHNHVAVGLKEHSATGHTSHLLAATVQFLRRVGADESPRWSRLASFGLQAQVE
jgi:hypothetical protein